MITDMQKSVKTSIRVELIVNRGENPMYIHIARKVLSFSIDQPVLNRRIEKHI